jgi:hypothetical protein
MTYVLTPEGHLIRYDKTSIQKATTDGWKDAGLSNAEAIDLLSQDLPTFEDDLISHDEAAERFRLGLCVNPSETICQIADPEDCESCQ